MMEEHYNEMAAVAAILDDMGFDKEVRSMAINEAGFIPQRLQALAYEVLRYSTRYGIETDEHEADEILQAVSRLVFWERLIAKSAVKAKRRRRKIRNGGGDIMCKISR
ncbi:hypothetical protein LCY76_09390 [Fictibacillus sp. KIGAM418]|uniref:Uncharacterized protein n=1 Tax=Fictibacillus marinisediminis TaxID=2878389 RepID=A0A9X1X9P0_9BACL|nr:hypothetical protein [Fictibacillus marinisediminis]MCK6256807.1 hypothetical protein [Fictibacillus marinisediminis]